MPTIDRSVRATPQFRQAETLTYLFWAYVGLLLLASSCILWRFPSTAPAAREALLELGLLTSTVPQPDPTSFYRSITEGWPARLAAHPAGSADLVAALLAPPTAIATFYLVRRRLSGPSLTEPERNKALHRRNLTPKTAAALRRVAERSGCFREIRQLDGERAAFSGRTLFIGAGLRQGHRDGFPPEPGGGMLWFIVAHEAVHHGCRDNLLTSVGRYAGAFLGALVGFVAYVPLGLGLAVALRDPLNWALPPGAGVAVVLLLGLVLVLLLARGTASLVASSICIRECFADQVAEQLFGRENWPYASNVGGARGDDLLRLVPQEREAHRRGRTAFRHAMLVSLVGAWIGLRSALLLSDPVSDRAAIWVFDLLCLLLVAAIRRHLPPQEPALGNRTAAAWAVVLPATAILLLTAAMASQALADVAPDGIARWGWLATFCLPPPLGLAVVAWLNHGEAGSAPPRGEVPTTARRRPVLEVLALPSRGATFLLGIFGLFVLCRSLGIAVVMASGLPGRDDAFPGAATIATESLIGLSFLMLAGRTIQSPSKAWLILETLIVVLAIIGVARLVHVMMGATLASPPQAGGLPTPEAMVARLRAWSGQDDLMLLVVAGLSVAILSASALARHRLRSRH